MADSVFTKIIKGELPSHKVYEDAKTLAFMDIHPTTPGMVVVVSKTQEDHFMDLSDDDYQALMATVKKIALKMRQVFPDKRVGVRIEGFDVPHAHVVMLPISSGKDIGKLADPDQEPDHPALASMARQLAL